MVYQFKNIIVLNLGGSIIYSQNKININFLKNFKILIEKELKKNKKRKLVIVVGGGYLARFLQNSVHQINQKISNYNQDILGIEATKVNAEIIKNLFNNKIVNPKIIDSEKKLKNLKFAITISAGWTPGSSTDYITAKIAKKLNLNEYILATKPDFIYNQDPEKYKNAIPLKTISWKEYLTKIVPPVWMPGLKIPIDIKAAKFSQQNHLKAIVINGQNLKNLDSLLNRKNFKGTLVD